MKRKQNPFTLACFLNQAVQSRRTRLNVLSQKDAALLLWPHQIIIERYCALNTVYLDILVSSILVRCKEIAYFLFFFVS